MLLLDAINRHVMRKSQKIALKVDDEARTWGDFGRRTDLLAQMILARGVEPGAPIALLLGNSLFHIEAMIGVMKAGCIVTPLSTMLNLKTLATLLDDCKPSVIFMAEDVYRRHPLLRKKFDNQIITENEVDALLDGNSDWKHPRSPFDDSSLPCSLIYSSGTTGEPKGILHSYAARSGYGKTFSEEYHITGESRALLTTAAYSNGSWMMILPTLYQGATLVIMPKYDVVRFLDVLHRDRITHCFLVPTQIKDIFTQGKMHTVADSSLRCLVSAGSYLEADLKIRVQKELKAEFYELFGNTEGVCTILRPGQMSAHPDSVGTAIMDGEIQIVDDEGRKCRPGTIGEVVGRGPLMSLGYFNKKEENRLLCWQDDEGNLFVRSGDLGEIDEEGFLHIRGRKKEMIISGGFNIFPVDLENELRLYDEVSDAAVIGIPHERWGEAPVAAVILKEGATCTEEWILTWFNERVNKHQRLQALFIVSDFPRNALGKVVKKELLASLPLDHAESTR